MTPSLRCTYDELPILATPWEWGGSRDTGWIARSGTAGRLFCVEASVFADDGIQICATVDGQAAHAPLVVILAVAMANGIDIYMVACDVSGTWPGGIVLQAAEIRHLEELIANPPPPPQRLIDLMRRLRDVKDPP